jgi:NADH-quinone oxidoreductase subunit M
MDPLNNALGFPILSLSIFLPLAGAIAIWLFVRGDMAVRWSALAVSVATFLVTLPLAFDFDPSTHHMWAWTASPCRSSCSPVC